jgi:hypothetical protein
MAIWRFVGKKGWAYLDVSCIGVDWMGKRHEGGQGGLVRNCIKLERMEY